MPKNQPQYLWTRFGDSGNYENWEDDLSAAAEDFVERQAGRITGWGPKGHCETEIYNGGDYVSLFWGDKEGNFIRDLNREEKLVIEKVCGTAGR